MIEQFLIYGSIVLALGLVVLGTITLTRLNKDIKRLDKNRRRSFVDYIRKTSKHRESRKRLKF